MIGDLIEGICVVVQGVMDLISSDKDTNDEDKPEDSNRNAGSSDNTKNIIDDIGDCITTIFD